MKDTKPEEKILEVVKACSDCDVCRHLMETDCLFFPELYKLWDKEQETGESISSKELKDLTERCNFCALCPCPNIRSDIIDAKTKFIDRDGMKYSVRVIEDVERIGKICGAFSNIFNTLMQNNWSATVLKHAFGIHPERKLPEFSKEEFLKWAKDRNLHIKRNPGKKRKVAFFAGCTGRYLFPDVAKAAVEVLQKNNVEVHVPEQKCCSMPVMLEGDQKLALEFAGFNLDSLSEAVDSGYDIICSCSTCGFMLKNLLREGAYYSTEYQQSVESNGNHLRVPAGRDFLNGRVEDGFVVLQKTIYSKILKDTGYFSSLSVQKRIRVAEHCFDLGEYLQSLMKRDYFTPPGRTVTGRLVYFPPCHGREQKIGSPYMDVLSLIPELELESIDGHFYCCGMGGIMGFKKGFS